jgi:hypothetical protein
MPCVVQVSSVTKNVANIMFFSVKKTLFSSLHQLAGAIEIDQTEN